MKVAHVGPPFARQGGPGGYLLQLQRAAAEAGATDVLFPQAAPARAAAAGTSAPMSWSPSPGVRRALGRVKRKVFGARRFYRPAEADLARPGGLVETLVADVRRLLVEEAAPSLEQAVQASADVWFCHDSATAEHALERRDRPQVWLFQHAPFPLALYQAWCWGVPEWDWHDVMQLPDVRTWTAWETDVWTRVDRFVLPCAEALEELVRVDSNVAALTPTVEYVLTGAQARDAGRTPASRDRRRKGWGFGTEPVGLFIGNNQPYRGLDALAAGVERLTPVDAAGVVAIAGPDPDMLPSHPRLRALGRVADVAGLLDAVDFVVNVNRFSLFDLSTIEAMEAGQPLLMHEVGGNKTFRTLGAGCVTMRDLAPDTVARGLREMFGLAPEARRALGEASRSCYEQHLTLAHFWRRHAELYARASARVRKAEFC